MMGMLMVLMMMTSMIVIIIDIIIIIIIIIIVFDDYDDHDDNDGDDDHHHHLLLLLRLLLLLLKTNRALLVTCSFYGTFAGVTCEISFLFRSRRSQRFVLQSLQKRMVVRQHNAVERLALDTADLDNTSTRQACP